ncbi:RNA polymerase beta prime subunit [Vibrio phage BONAISHI]|nr:RNA polymerase beta prime subunit [Vibrio phage BONAISHI]
MNRDFTAWEIANMPRAQVAALPRGGLRVTFRDGKVIKCKTEAVKESWFYWRVFAENGLDLITSIHFIGNEGYNTGTHKKMCSLLHWAVFMGKYPDLQPGQGIQDFWDLSRRIYFIGNEVFNSSTHGDTAYMKSLDLMDLVEITEHPVVVEAKQKFRDGEISVDECNDQVWFLLLSDDPDMQHNPVAQYARAGIYNRRQIVQMCGVRANIPDTNGEAFGTHIDVSYVEGLSSNFDRTIESRTASIAYANAKGPLEDSQYNNRQCQLMGSVITGIYHGDCKSNKPLAFAVNNKADLDFITGKYIITEKGYYLVRGHEENLIGTEVKYRSITTCDHKDTSSPCAVCMGIAAWTTPPGTSPGHHLMIEALAKIAQNLLSTKHVISSTTCLYVNETGTNAGWLKLDPDNKQMVYLDPNLRQNKYTMKLRVAKEEAMFITDVDNIDNIDDLDNTRISFVSIAQMILYDERGRARQTHDLDFTVSNAGCPLSHEFLRYAKKKGWDISGNSYEFDMSDWNYDEPIMVTPRRGEDMMAILVNVRDFLDSVNKVGTVRAADFDNPGPAIRSLYEIMQNGKIHVNMINVEVFIRALMSRLDENGDPTFELPRGSEPFTFIRKKDAIKFRSIGPALGFEGQDSILGNPKTYQRKNLKIPAANIDALWGI